MIKENKIFDIDEKTSNIKKSLSFKYDTWRKIQELKFKNNFRSMDELLNKMIRDFKK